MITPLVWSRQHETYEMYKATDPGVGKFSTSRTSEDQIVRFRYVPAPPEGKTIADMFRMSQEIHERLGDDCFLNDEWNHLRSHISAIDDVGYAYSQPSLEKLIDLARTRPTYAGSHDQFLRENGFKFRSHVGGSTKTYQRNVKTGAFIIWRSHDNIHATFEFNRNSAWNNIFRVNMIMLRFRAVLPDYLNLDTTVHLAVEAARLYEEDGFTSRRRRVI